MTSLFTNRRRIWVIPATFLASYVLISFPVGPQWRGYVPDWVTLVLIYWCMAAPQRVGVGAAWLVGLGLDLPDFRSGWQSCVDQDSDCVPGGPRGAKAQSLSCLAADRLYTNFACGRNCHIGCH